LSTYKGTFLAGGLDGILIQSGNLWKPPVINAMPQVKSGGFVFSYNQQIDVPYRVQVSTNLLSWQDVYAGVGTGVMTNYTDTVSGNGVGRFFRIVSP
jgi:hypothetical protein